MQNRFVFVVNYEYKEQLSSLYGEGLLLACPYMTSERLHMTGFERQ